MKKMTVNKYQEVRDSYEYTKNDNNMIITVVNEFYEVESPENTDDENMVTWLAKNGINEKELNSTMHEYYFE